MQDVSTSFCKAALAALHYTGLDTALARVTQGSGVIFMLHHVVPGVPRGFAPNRILSITPEFLSLVVAFVKARGFECVSLDDAHARMAAGRTGDTRFATFTFDDGYRDNIKYALPILERHGVPMTIYLTPDFCDGTGRAWWVTLERVLAAGEEITVGFEDGERRFDLRTNAGKFAAHRDIYGWLRAKPDAQIQDIVDGWAAAAGIDAHAACRELVLGWDEVRVAARHPLVTFGAHTMTHAALAKMTDDEAFWEMAASIEHVEHEVRRPCRHFAYPYGDRGNAGPREFEMARHLDLKTAVTTRKGLIAPDVRGQLTALPRLSLNGDFQDARYLKVLLTGAPFKMLDLARAALPRRAA